MLFHGPDEDADLPFLQGFSSFKRNYDYHNPETQLDTCLGYLKFIGIELNRSTVLKAIEAKFTTYQKLLTKTFYLLRQLSLYNEDLPIDNPYHNNQGDLYFFLRIEEYEQGKPIQLTIYDELELPDLFNKYIEIPPGYEERKEVKLLFDLLENTDDSVFITGKAGTGKSTFIQYFTSKTQKKALLLAFTGIAAVNVGGQTIHSFFRFPLKPLLPDDPDIPVFNPKSRKYHIIETLDTIVIDEVSMLRADVLQAIDYSLRQNGGNPDEAFGGKQIVIVGDIFQLPPVVNFKDQIERELFENVYESEYFFACKAYQMLKPTFIVLETVHRQKDLRYVQLLNKVRDTSINSNELEQLNERYTPHFEPNNEKFIITLSVNNYIADTVNKKQLDKLPYESRYFQARVQGDYPESKYPTKAQIELRRGAQVIFIKNDSYINGRRWINGTIGRLEFIEDDKLEVQLQDGNTHTVLRETWENRKYEWNKQENRITSVAIGTFEQFPIKLAWAITIHKSQGLTFENVCVDLGTGAFVNGQVYTALSRCKTLDGLVLKRKITLDDIIHDQRLINFHRQSIQNQAIPL